MTWENLREDIGREFASYALTLADVMARAFFYAVLLQDRPVGASNDVNDSRMSSLDAHGFAIVDVARVEERRAQKRHAEHLRLASDSTKLELRRAYKREWQRAEHRRKSSRLLVLQPPRICVICAKILDFSLRGPGKPPTACVGCRSERHNARRRKSA